MKTVVQTVIAQIVVTQLDDNGQPIGEFVSSPVKVFRATAKDFWSECDKAKEQMLSKQQLPESKPLKKAK